MKRVKVTLANRFVGGFWSVEELFSNITKAFPEWVNSTMAAAPRGRANLGSLIANVLWMRSLKDCDLIHQTGDIHYAILGVWRRPVVLTILDLRFIEEARGIKRFLFWWLWLYLPCLRANQVTVISEFTKARLLALCRVKPEKVRVIPCCVAPEFTAMPKPWPSNKPRLLQIGTTDNKNLSRVIQACAGLSLQFSILGKLTDSQRQQLDRQGVEFEEFRDLPKDQVVALYAASDLVVFVSTYEGFGIPILEAQAVGRPVLTSDISPMREVAGGGALLVDPFDTGAIHEGLARICRDAELRESLVQAGFENVRKYSAAIVAEAYGRVYAEMAHAHDSAV
jgi:glycosyltransferase involved in cell wall biosynthesis